MSRIPLVDASVAVDLLARYRPEPIERALWAPGTHLAAPELLDIEALHALRRLGQEMLGAGNWRKSRMVWYHRYQATTRNPEVPQNPQSPEKFRRYRQRLKARGLRQIQLWVPDTTSPDFQTRLESQLRRVEAGDEDRQSLDLIEDIADWSD